MKSRNLWVYFLGILLLISCSREDYNREVVDFNFDWSFHLDENINWEKVRLPHTFRVPFNSIEQKNGNLSQAIGWYKKSFSLKKADQEEVIWLEFKGTYGNLELRLNGNLLNKDTESGKITRYILSENVVFDKPNEILVKVENPFDTGGNEYRGLGICPSMQLVRASTIYIKTAEIQVSTNGKQDDIAIVNISAKIQNNQTNTLVKATIIDPDGKKISSHELSSNNAFSKQVEIPNPQLWELSKPHLYQLTLQVLDESIQIDSISRKFSIRSIDFKTDDFILNSIRQKIKGANISPNAGIIGSDITKPSWIYAINKLKSIGVNTISLPKDLDTTEIQEYCDELGMLLVDRNFTHQGFPTMDVNDLRDDYFFDYAGFQTAKGHYFQSLWNDRPKVFALTSSTKTSVLSSNSNDDAQQTQNLLTALNEHWNYNEGEEVLVQVYTNCDEVELLVNNKSKGRKKLKDFAQEKIIKWIIPFEAGNVIIKGFKNGKHVAGHALFTNNNAFSAKLFSDKDTLRADKYDLAFVELHVYDDGGHKMNGTDLPVKFTISGKGEILGVSNGLADNSIEKQDNKVNTHKGKAIAIVRNTGKPGEIIIQGWLEERQVAEKKILVRQ